MPPQCPFDEADLLSTVADGALKETQKKRIALTETLMPTLNDEQKKLFRELDDLTLHEINLVQTASVRAFVCAHCDKAQVCRK